MRAEFIVVQIYLFFVYLFESLLTGQLSAAPYVEDQPSHLQFYILFWCLPFEAIIRPSSLICHNVDFPSCVGLQRTYYLFNGVVPDAARRCKTEQDRIFYDSIVEDVAGLAHDHDFFFLKVDWQAKA